MERKVNYSHPLISNLKIKLGPLILRPLNYPHGANQKTRESFKLILHEHLGEQVNFLIGEKHELGEREDVRIPRQSSAFYSSTKIEASGNDFRGKQDSI